MTDKNKLAEFGYSVLIPALNAEKTLSRLLNDLEKIEPSAQEILVVNDGSDDRTAQIARTANVTVIDYITNMGKGNALRSGFKHYSEQNYTGYVLCMDADLQHPPEYIPDFIKYARNTGCQFIIGNREKKIGTMPAHRIMSNRITSFIISVITGQKIPDSQCGFRLIHSDVIKNLEMNEDGFQFESEMILKAANHGVKIGFVSIPVIYNDAGSHIGNVRDTFKFISMVLKYIFLKKVAKRQSP